AKLRVVLLLSSFWVRRGWLVSRVVSPDMPNIGVVERDPNFKPLIELVPPKPPTPAPAVPEQLGSDSAPPERGARGRGGRGGRGRGAGGSGGSGGAGRDERADLGERPE